MKIVTIIVILFCCFFGGNNKNITKDTIDIETIITTHKSKCNIDSFTKEKQHYFDLKINHCFKGLINNTTEEPITFLLYRKKSCVCIIEEIKFKDDKSVINTYTTLYKEAESVRKGPRNSFGNVCFELREAQFFYILKKEKTLYLISDGNSYNYKYLGGNDSVDAITKRDQRDKNELIHDDIARLIEHY